MSIANLNSGNASFGTFPDYDAQIAGLQADMFELTQKFNHHKMLTDLIVVNAIDRFQYFKLNNMLMSNDDGTVEMASKIIQTKHLKVTDEIMASKPIELGLGIPSVENDSRSKIV